MKKKELISEQEKQLFKEAIGSVKPLLQDTIQPTINTSSLKVKTRLKAQKNQDAAFYFSDEYEAYFNSHGPIKYVRENVNSAEAKSLRQGLHTPDLIVDLHGLTQQQAKYEIAAMLSACEKEHASCVCIVHGIGSKVLKNRIPHWLVQHPKVRAFHQATLEWGGAGALLVLVDLPDKLKF
jgi:DNA-nicking Smr family endonuclease